MKTKPEMVEVVRRLYLEGKTDKQISLIVSDENTKYTQAYISNLRSRVIRVGKEDRNTIHKRILEIRQNNPDISISEIAKELRISDVGVARILQQFSHLSQKIRGMGTEPENVKHAWIKDEDVSAFMVNPMFAKHNFHKVFEDTLQTVKDYAPKYPKITYKSSKDPHLALLGIADPHFGDNTGLARERVSAGILDALHKVQPFNIEKFIFTGGNDVLQIDTPLGTTTKGTQVPHDMPFDEMFEQARETYIAVLEQILTVAPVHYVHILSNHDETLGWALSQVLQAWFHNNPNITFDIAYDPRKYVKYGDNLIALDHGHWTKEDHLPLVVAQEAPQLWGTTKYRYCYRGHIHHNRSVKWKDTKDYTGIKVESLPSSTDTNDYEKKLGFLTTPSIVTYVHSPNHGQIAKFIKNF